MGKKSPLDVRPQLVRRRLLADLSTCTYWFWRKFSWDPRLKREENFLKAAPEAKNTLHRPSEVIASAGAHRFCIFEISAREATATCD